MSAGKQMKGKITGTEEVANRDEALRILTEMARKGSIQAAIALARELRAVDKEQNSDLDQELDRLLQTK